MFRFINLIAWFIVFDYLNTNYLLSNKMFFAFLLIITLSFINFAIHIERNKTYDDITNN